MTSANIHVGGPTANGSRDAVSFVLTSLGLTSILLLTPGSLPLPSRDQRPGDVAKRPRKPERIDKGHHPQPG